MEKKITLKDLKRIAKETKNKIIPVSKREIKFATREIFEMIQRLDRSNNIQRNREVNVKKLRKEIKYPVIFAMMHEDIRNDEIRVMFVANKTGDEFIQDMSVKTFENLPTTMVIDR